MKTAHLDDTKHVMRTLKPQTHTHRCEESKSPIRSTLTLWARNRYLTRAVTSLFTHNHTHTHTSQCHYLPWDPYRKFSGDCGTSPAISLVSAPQRSPGNAQGGCHLHPVIIHDPGPDIEPGRNIMCQHSSVAMRHVRQVYTLHSFTTYTRLLSHTHRCTQGFFIFFFINWSIKRDQGSLNCMFMCVKW